MRTTVEIKDALRAELLKAAAERGQKGFSEIIEEALKQYFEGNRSVRDRQREALSLRGKIGRSDALALRAHVDKVRGSWR